MILKRAIVAFAVLLALTSAPSQATEQGRPLLSGGTDQPLWRALHAPLLTIAHAGKRLIAAGDRGTILLSDDQGNRWRAIPSGTEALLTASVFTSPSEGWIVGQDATILHTKDAGQSWTVQTKNAGADQALFSVADLGGNHLIATGSYALILETRNGGANWTPDQIPNLDEDYHLNCVLPRGEDVLITGEAGHAFIRRGTSWTAMNVPYDGSQFGCLATKEGDIYSFGLRGSLFVLTQAATAWKRIDTGEQRSIFGGTMLSSGFLALVGGNGLCLLFDPQTGKLRTLPPPTGATLSSVAETGSGKWIVVGSDGIHIVDPTIESPAGAAQVTQ